MFTHTIRDGFKYEQSSFHKLKEGAFDMHFKKSIVAIMVALFFILSAGVVFGGNPVLVSVKVDGDTYKLKINSDNGKFFVRDVSGGKRLCAMHVLTPNNLTNFLACVAATIGGEHAINAIEDAVKKAM